MSRTIPTNLLIALTQDSIQPYQALKLEFDSGNLCLWTGIGDKTINGDVYLGVGDILEVSPIEEAADLSAKGVSVSLAGVPTELTSKALQEPYQRRKCTILLGDESTTDTLEVFAGVIDTMTIEDAGETSTISLSIESKLVELEKPRDRRYTSESHKSRYPNDTFLDFIADLQDKDIAWGRPDED